MQLLGEFEFVCLGDRDWRSNGTDTLNFKLELRNLK